MLSASILQLLSALVPRHALAGVPACDAADGCLAEFYEMVDADEAFDEDEVKACIQQRVVQLLYSATPSMSPAASQAAVDLTREEDGGTAPSTGSRARRSQQPNGVVLRVSRSSWTPAGEKVPEPVGDGRGGVRRVSNRSGQPSPGASGRTAAPGRGEPEESFVVVDFHRLVEHVADRIIAMNAVLAQYSAEASGELTREEALRGCCGQRRRWLCSRLLLVLLALLPLCLAAACWPIGWSLLEPAVLMSRIARGSSDAFSTSALAAWLSAAVNTLSATIAGATAT